MCHHWMWFTKSSMYGARWESRLEGQREYEGCYRERGLPQTWRNTQSSPLDPSYGVWTKELGAVGTSVCFLNALRLFM